MPGIRNGEKQRVEESLPKPINSSSSQSHDCPNTTSFQHTLTKSNQFPTQLLPPTSTTSNEVAAVSSAVNKPMSTAIPPQPMSTFKSTTFQPMSTSIPTQSMSTSKPSQLSIAKECFPCCCSKNSPVHHRFPRVRTYNEDEFNRVLTGYGMKPAHANEHQNDS